jgi:cytoskeletal protein CcmA (bactofilin family)
MLTLNPETHFTYIGQKSSIKGQFTFHGPLFIEGLIEGDILLKGDHILHLGRDGKVIGNITCYEAEIFGEFVGKILVQGKLIIHPSAKISAEQISAKNLIVRPGAQIDGNHQIGEQL